MIKVALVAGHDSYHMHGAVAFGVSENEFWNDFIKDLKFILAGCGVEIEIFYRGNQKVLGYKGSMRKLHEEIDSWGADIDLELHFNASASPAVGHEVLYLDGSKNGRKYALMLDECFDDRLPNKDRNVKPLIKGDRGWYGVKIGKSASLISEAFFGKELESFIEGGEHRANLMNAYIDFFKKLI